MPVVQMFMLGVIVFIVLTILYFVPIGMWIQGIVSLGLGRIRIVDLIRMRLRKISPRLVTDGVINLHKAGLTNISTDMLETHFLAGGNVNMVVDGLVSAKENNLNLTFDQIAKLDFEDKNIPTVLNCRECGAEVTTTKICKNCHAKFPAIDSKSYKKLRKTKVMFVAGLTITVITIVIKLLDK